MAARDAWTLGVLEATCRAAGKRTDIVHQEWPLPKIPMAKAEASASMSRSPSSNVKNVESRIFHLEVNQMLGMRFPASFLHQPGAKENASRSDPGPLIGDLSGNPSMAAMRCIWFHTFPEVKDAGGSMSPNGKVSTDYQVGPRFLLFLGVECHLRHQNKAMAQLSPSNKTDFTSKPRAFSLHPRRLVF